MMDVMTLDGEHNYKSPKRHLGSSFSSQMERSMLMVMEKLFSKPLSEFKYSLISEWKIAQHQLVMETLPT